ncbi:MAG: hypothetical protein QM771_04560 [Nitrospira sp.]
MIETRSAMRTDYQEIRPYRLGNGLKRLAGNTYFDARRDRLTGRLGPFVRTSWRSASARK